MGAKNQRQYRIAKLISQMPISAQQQIVDLLAAEGISATQATVSRDLDELGAIKVKGPSGTSVYAIPELPKDQTATEGYLHRVMGEWVVEVVYSSPIVMLKTPPGCAHVVASAMDRAKPEGILGTVAGDDTVMVLASEKRGAARVAMELAEIAGLSVTEEH
jgi:transcriptional regulator of arginine metabolism